MLLANNRSWRILLTGLVASFLSSTALADDVLPIRAENHIIGVAAYRGGLARDLEVALTAPIAMRAFSIEIPAFCRDVEVLEAGARSATDAILVVRRSPTDDQKFLVAAGTDGSAAQVAKILVTINGPLNAGCDIPVMDSEDSDPTDPPPPPVHPSHPGDGVYMTNHGLRIDITRGRVLRHNFTVTTPGIAHAGPVILTSPLIGRMDDPSVYLVRGYADFPVHGAAGPGFCRYEVSFDLRYSGPLWNDLSLRFNHPSFVGLDAWGRCVAGGMTSTTWFMRRAGT